MLVAILAAFLFVQNGKCEIVIPLENTMNPVLINCSTNIIQKYMEVKKLSYVDFSDASNDLLTEIHSLRITAVKFIRPPCSSFTGNLGYIIILTDPTELKENMFNLYEDEGWNPYARFLVIIKSLRWHQLRQVFDVFLHLRVNSVVILNGTATAELYTYNPYDEYACGKYYSKIKEFGKCLDVTTNIYPEKVTTGLKKCFFNVSVPQWPPYSIDPSLVQDGSYLIGTDQYIFKLISEIEQFSYKFHYEYDPESFSVVSQNMSVSGPLLLLMQNRTDVMLGGLILVPSRTKKFFFLSGHLDFVDEVRIMVKKAGEIPPWKNFYLEFSPVVWGTLLLAFMSYSALIMILLRAKDKGQVTLILLDNLLSHGPKFKCRQAVKCVFIFWLWFAYLINCFYTTSLMSLTTKPSFGRQISDEKTAQQMNLDPCISLVMDRYRKSESNYPKLLNDVEVGIDGCEKFVDSIRTTSHSDRMFTLILYSVYLYHKQKLYDKWGNSPVYSFTKPYSKIIYAMYFNKGFPMYERLHKLAIRIRETGLSDKSLNDHYYKQKIKYIFRPRGFEARFGIPWYLYFIGLFVSSVTFGVELTLYKNKIKLIVPTVE